jgi:peptidoglycan/LPS O-acetylase OafA/YrhL
MLWNFAYSLPLTWLLYRTYRGFGGITGALLGSPIMVYLGRISYGLYLYHLLMPHWIAPVARALGLDFWYGGFLNLALSSAAAVLAASLSWRFIEEPINRFKDRFRPAVSPTTAVRPRFIAKQRPAAIIPS